MYVDANYYEEEYGGIAISGTAFLFQLIKRAERDINVRTNYRITDFSKLTTFQQERVKEAVCAQIEFLAENGELSSTVSNGGGSVSIGSYSESGGSADSKKVLFADNVDGFLWPTGLLYGGIGVVG
ncbi:head-tail connector protein [Carnobacterium pleistocenium]|uniref:hypothetical protein n=1 Tax=Carnobacterium pleistocenium TaxID=181073 RepID=UPI0005521253|nr:hypothetical protein [Carnobacterium pleistocenium]